jgi:hypothetical protein
VDDRLERLRRDYRPAFLAYLVRRDEGGLRAAYELGRAAMADGVRLLDVVQVHHGVFLQVITEIRHVDELPALVEPAAAFLLEALAPFELTRRSPGELA